MQARALEGKDPDDARVRLTLSRIELDVLRMIPHRLRELLLHPERSKNVLDRLFPVTHRDDPALEREHRALIGDSLLKERQENLDAFDRTLAAGVRRPLSHRLELTAAQVDLWLHVLNDLRLLIATELGISSNSWWDDGPPNGESAQDFHFLEFLSAVQEGLLRAVSGR